MSTGELIARFERFIAAALEGLASNPEVFRSWQKGEGMKISFEQHVARMAVRVGAAASKNFIEACERAEKAKEDKAE